MTSSIMGRTDYKTTFVSDLEKLEYGFFDGMRITKLRICGDNDNFYGVQGFVKDSTRYLSLEIIGQAKLCQDIAI